MTRAAFISAKLARAKRAELDAALRRALPELPRAEVAGLAEAIDELIDERNALTLPAIRARHDDPARFERLEQAARAFAAAVGAIRDPDSQDRVELEQWAATGKKQFPGWRRTAEAAEWAGVTAAALARWREREVDARRRPGAPAGGANTADAKDVDVFTARTAELYLQATGVRPTAANAAFVAVLDAACIAADIGTVPERTRLARLLKRWHPVGRAPARGKPKLVRNPQN